MIYETRKSKIEGVYELTPNTFKDERGTISKIFQRDSFEEMGLDCAFNETLVTRNYQKRVVRGFHYQRAPYGQAKTLFAASGGFIDIVLDIRVNSGTYGQTEVFELTEEKSNVLFLPKDVANCYCIMKDNTIIVYNLTSKYMPDYATGYRYDSIDFKYPFDELILSENDLQLPLFGGNL